ncbi:sensor histidine kinase [Vibrio sonorensis]|uniref:sensor histidine kinase n=1 Tax=Vibrio sonorensis TaxID=1004316 RepID=UPI0008DA50BF|nr:HAMP domain-containing sensor histidine kinase [Vibrio sonorensis]
MSFVDDYALTRSSIFKILIMLFLVVAIINMFAIRQVFVESDEFHRNQLDKQLDEEILEFKYSARYGDGIVVQLLNTKKYSETPFTYRLIENDTPPPQSLYPVSYFMQRQTTIPLTEKYRLDIAVKSDFLESYRSALIPLVMSGIVLPTAIMLVAAVVFTIMILRKLERVNSAMNRVLCGERSVKIPVSQQDDEFDILAIHLNFMIEQMAKNEATLKSLTVGLAHDMRTPMARLKLRLEEMLARQNLTLEEEDQISACHEELELILSLFNSMLEIARLNSGQQNIEHQAIDLGKIAHDAMEFLLPLAEQKDQILIYRHDQTCLVNGDRSLLFRAVFNLIDNAVKYTPKNGTIEVFIDSLGVTVADNGIGIPKDEMHKVCKTMYRADKSRTQQGNGIGLSLVEAVVRRHKARLIMKQNNPGLRVRLLFEQ